MVGRRLSAGIQLPPWLKIVAFIDVEQESLALSIFQRPLDDFDRTNTESFSFLIKDV